jgi:putative NIF3 family GTP cyclohydrolase 1 type 2
MACFGETNQAQSRVGSSNVWLCVLQNDINLLAYHLPLDAHPSSGNNAQLAAHLGFSIDSIFGDQGLGFVGSSSVSLEDAQALTHHLQSRLGKQPVVVVPDKNKPIRRIAWCTGALKICLKRQFRTA